MSPARVLAAASSAALALPLTAPAPASAATGAPGRITPELRLTTR